MDHHLRWLIIPTFSRNILLPLVWLTGESEAAMDIFKSGGDEFVD